MDDPQQRSSDGSPAADEPIAILIPTFNDWEALSELLANLDRALAPQGLGVGVLIVDDGSTLPEGEGFAVGEYEAIKRVDVLELRRNLGHQRAIAIGLAFVEECGSCEALVVMDGDGEDDPRDVPRLLARLRDEGGEVIVFADRARRSESPTFRLFYALYKILHFWMTGIRVRVGNFSVVPRKRLASLVVVSELWNHYAAASFKSRQPYCTIPTHRAARLRGTSKMNFVNLVIHGLSAISVFSEVVGVRLLVLAIGLVALTLATVGVTLSVRLLTSLAIPDWATSSIGILLVILVQALMMTFLFSFVVLDGRRGSNFLPRRDYAYFVGRVRTAWPKPKP